MIKIIDKSNIGFIIIGLIIVFYVFGVMAVTNVLIAILLIYSIFFTQNVWQRIKSSFLDIRIWCFYTVFFLALIGLLNSENISEGLRYVEQRIAFILIPLPVYLITLKQHQVRKLLLLFCICCTVVSIFSLLDAFFNYLETNDTGYFYSDNLAYVVNSKATYLSIFINFSIFLIFYFLFEGKIKTIRAKVLMVMALVQLIVFNFLLANRLSLALLAFFIIAFLIYYIISKRKYTLGVCVLLSFILVIFLLINLMPRTVKRFKSITNTSFEYSNMNDENHINREVSEDNWNGLTLRLAIWSSALSDSKEFLLTGVGTGDYRDELFKRYDYMGFEYGKMKRYGIHNLYLYYFFVHGIFGFLLFTAAQVYLLVDSFKKKYPPYFLFMVMMLATFVVSNVINVYSGIVFYVLFASLFCFNDLKD